MRNPRPVILSLALLAVATTMLASAGSAAARTTGFHIWNFTREAVRVTNVDTFATPQGERVFSNDSDAPKPPRRNLIVQPGEQLHVELENPFSYTRRATLELAGGEASYRLVLDNYFGVMQCGVERGKRQCGAQGGRIELLEASGTVVRIGSGDIQAQAQVLKTLCTAANDCEFEPLQELKTETASAAVGSSLTNCQKKGGLPDDTTITREDKVAISNSVGIESQTSFTIFKIFKESITIKYKHERTDTHTFKQAVHVNVPPEEMGWVAASVPVIRDLGEFTLNAGDTKWILEDVAFDSPDPSRGEGNFIARYAPLSPEKYRAECEEPPKKLPMAPGSSLLQTPIALVETQDDGTAAADLMRGGPESNTLRGLGGHDLLRGGGGHDSLLGGGGRDLIKGGPGEDMIKGGPGADRIDDAGGPTAVGTGANSGPSADRVDVADGRGDDTVTCDTPRTTVIVDPGDEVDGPCGQVIIEGG